MSISQKIQKIKMLVRVGKKKKIKKKKEQMKFKMNGEREGSKRMKE